MKKLIFADQLRGVAALSVILVHLCGVYWAFRDLVAGLIGAPALQGASSRQLDAINLFSFGPFGVSLFFLISGFVIAFSIDKLTPVRFLIARLFRIYPTYLVGLCITQFAIFISTRYWHSRFSIDINNFFSNAVLIHTVMGIPSMDTVNWTLAIEVKFYIVVAMMAVFSLHKKVWGIVGVSAIITLFISIIPYDAIKLGLLGSDLNMVPYMFVGMVINLHMQGKVHAYVAFKTICGLMALVFINTFILFHKGVPQSVVLSVYLPTIGVFVAAYVGREVFRKNRFFDGLAKISFPLYVTHAIVGYVGLRILQNIGVGPVFSLVIVLAAIACLACVLHIVVEEPSAKFGKRLVKG